MMLFQFLGKEYDRILEVYFCCTYEDKTFRPAALDIAVILQDI